MARYMMEMTCNVLGIDRVDMDNKMVLIEEQHGTNANFLVNAILSNALKKENAVCLVLCHNTFGHYHNIGMRLGYNLLALREKGQVTVVEPMKSIASDVADMCKGSLDKDRIMIADTRREHVDIAHRLFTRVRERYDEAASFSNASVTLIIDDINHLLNFGLGVHDVMHFVRYLRSFMAMRRATQLCILAHTYGEDAQISSAGMIANGLRHMAHLCIKTEPLKTGYSGNASGKLSIYWRTYHVRSKYHWAERKMYLFKLLDWFSGQEYALVKKVWSEIEINPQFHGNAYLRNFCETYPQYVKFFTLEHRLPANFDARTTAKFSTIVETMGYLLLDFNNKPKQLDRFVGYIAMVHKDMRLDEQDMHNFVSSLFEYLSQTYPVRMTEQCRAAMSKYMNNIVKELSKKMETFRRYDIAQADETAMRSKLPWRRCALFVDPLIFGKTKSHWDEWKRQWDERLDEWTARDSVTLDSIPRSLTDEDRVVKSEADDDYDESATSILQRRASILTRKRRTGSDVSASRLALLTLSKTSVDVEAERTPGDGVHRADENYRRSRRSARPSRELSEATSPRERRRAKRLDRALDETIPEERDEETTKREHNPKIVPESRIVTAREKRRERHDVDPR